RGLKAQDTRVITVANVAPTASAGGAYAAVVGSPVTFGAIVSDAGPADAAAGFSYLWTFGDGATSTDPSPHHAYAAPGRSAATLPVWDKDRASTVASPSAVVSAPPVIVAQALLRTFTLQESFGVSHPSQIIELDPGQPIDPANTYLIGPDGQPA